MSKNTTTLFHNILLTFQHLLWLGFVLLFASLLVVSWSIVMILFQVFFLATWLLDVMSPRGQALVSMLEESGESIVEYVEGKSNTPGLSRFLKSSKQLLSAVLKTVYEAGQQLYTFLFGTKR